MAFFIFTENQSNADPFLHTYRACPGFLLFGPLGGTHHSFLETLACSAILAGFYI
jgi:hypothetical protein